MANSTPLPILNAIRAILVSHFPERYTRETLLPKLREHNIDVIDVVNAERTPDFSVKNADIVICMKDLMSHNAADNAKFVAKRNQRPFITLTRKAAEWDAKLSRYTVRPAPSSRRLQEPVSLPATPAETSAPDSVVEVEEVEEPTNDDLHELLKMFEDENARLEAETKQLVQRLKDTDALASVLEKQLEQEKKANKHLEKQLAERPAPKKVIDKEALLTWDRLMRGVRSGNAPDFHALLEFAAVVDINVTELLALMKG